MRERIIIGISGASGTRYGVRLVEVLLEMGHEVHLVITQNGQQVHEFETGENMGVLEKRLDSTGSGKLRIHDNADLFAPPASG